MHPQLQHQHTLKQTWRTLRLVSPAFAFFRLFRLVSLGFATVAFSSARFRLVFVRFHMAATSSGLDAPNLETDKFFTGTSPVFDLVSHELWAYVSAVTDEAEIESMRTHGRNGSRLTDAFMVGGLPRTDGGPGAGRTCRSHTDLTEHNSCCLFFCLENFVCCIFALRLRRYGVKAKSEFSAALAQRIPIGAATSVCTQRDAEVAELADCIRPKRESDMVVQRAGHSAQLTLA